LLPVTTLKTPGGRNYSNQAAVHLHVQTEESVQTEEIVSRIESVGTRAGLRDRPDASSAVSIENKEGFNHELRRMNDGVKAAETAFAAIETRPARSAKSWSIEADVKELEPSVTAT
jgi:hypothetical protein